MRSRLSLVVAAAVVSGMIAAPVRADMKSTIDEWADRFVPEATPKIELPSYADELDRAEAEVIAGKYRAALSTLTSVKRNDPFMVDTLRARALAGLGEVDEAIAALGDRSKDVQKQVIAGNIHLEASRPADALTEANHALTADDGYALAHLLKGQSLEALGRFDEAVTAYKWFVDGQQSFLMKWRNDPLQFEDPDELTAIATAINRWATISQAYKELPDLNDTILNMFIRVFDVVDREHVNSRIAAAEFAMTRGDGKKAAAYLGPALERAQRDPRVLRIGIQLGMASNNEAGVRRAIEMFRDADPDSFDAAFWETVLLARSQQWVQAADRADALRETFPNRIEALGLAGALQFIRGDEPALAARIAEADAIAPGRSDALILAGSILSNAYQKAAAEELLKQALKRTPWEQEARHELGDIYINEGREADAMAVLDEAYKTDPYNIKTVNFLRLLEEIARYQKVQTEHFIFYFDGDADPIVADQIGPYMEEVYKDVTSVFQYEPPMKIIVQVYPNDDEFSVRLAGVPGIENFGVSFGRVLATIAPRRGTKQGNFNFARVLKHEFVHTVNLLQTNHRTPRWLTEGLAVWQEGVPFRFKDVPEELYTRTMNGKLFTIRGIPMAFIRPKVPADGEQAYTQGAYLAKYMDATFGRDSIVKLLNAYATSKSDEDAFRAATGRSIKEVEEGWHAWMKEKLKPWGYDKESKDKVKALVEEGEAAIKSRKFADAQNPLAEAYSLQPYNLTVNQRLALVYLQKETSDPAKAIEHLKFLHILELQNNKIAKQISRLYTDMNDLPNALKWAKEATYVDLYDASAHEMIEQIATKMNDDKAAELARTTAERIKLWELNRKGPPKPAATD